MKANYLFRFIQIYCLWLIPFGSVAQKDTIVLPLNIDSIEWQQSLLHHALMADKVPTNLPFNEVEKLNHTNYSFDTAFIKDDKCAWLHFNVKNPSLTDSLSFIITFNSRIHFVTLFVAKEPHQFDSIAGGRLTDYYKRPFVTNKSCFKQTLPPQYTGSFWLKFNNFSENRNNLKAKLVSLKTEETERMQERISDFPSHAIAIIYLSIFAFLALFAARMGYIWLDEGYKWYAVYTGAFFVFYFRDFENYSNDNNFFFSYFSSWHFKIEASICYITYIAYMIFIQKFLDLKQFYPNLNRIISTSIALLIFFAILDVILHLTMGLAVSFQVFIYVRIVFFIFYFVILFFIGYSTRSSLSRFIVFGTILMIVPGFTSNIAMALGGDTQIMAYGLYWLYEFPNAHIPMYSTRIGIILEAICFIFGLSWKAKREYEQLKNMAFKHNPLIVENQKSIELTHQPILSPNDKQNNPIDERIPLAFKKLEENFKNPDFNVAQWAQSMHISTSHFSKLIFDNTQESPSIHLQRSRLSYAQLLLRTSSDSITDIAENSGYSDSNYFSRIFKKTYHCTPSEWQKKQ